MIKENVSILLSENTSLVLEKSSVETDKRLACLARNRKEKRNKQKRFGAINLIYVGSKSKINYCEKKLLLISAQLCSNIFIRFAMLQYVYLAKLL